MSSAIKIRQKKALLSSDNRASNDQINVMTKSYFWRKAICRGRCAKI